ncbi:hypothetical protein BRD08_11295 [Halobacteriales archaeon SW_10_66_29]|nr:MAG: hypothetical protein BRD08_11295 [Halobacteriales archaeon SW_10_66_29]
MRAGPPGAGACSTGRRSGRPTAGRRWSPRPIVPNRPPAAADRDVDDGDRVRVATGGAAVEGVAVLDDAVRQGTVSMHATLADPLVRAGVDRVSIELLAGASGRDAPGEGGP